jgi:hypothetical protein
MNPISPGILYCTRSPGLAPAPGSGHEGAG